MSPNADFSPESAVEVMFKRIITFFDYKFERTDSPSKPAAKGTKRDGGKSTTSERLSMVRFRLHRLYQFLICSRFNLAIFTGCICTRLLQTRQKSCDQ